jgi:hypothetical protein
MDDCQFIESSGIKKSREPMSDTTLLFEKIGNQSETDQKIFNLTKGIKQTSDSS